jgi:hypothetical protein
VRRSGAKKGERDGDRRLLSTLGRGTEGKKGKGGGGPGQGRHTTRERARGLAPIGGQHPNRVPADRGPTAACSVLSRSGRRRVTDTRDPADSGRGREEREGRARVGRPGRKWPGPSPKEQRHLGFIQINFK